MDIHQLIDSDTSGSRPRKEVEKLHNLPPGYQQHREQRPPQPPPLRPPAQIDFRSPSASSYHQVLSPYQKTPSSTLGSSQYPFPQPSIHSPANSAKANSAKANSGHPYEAQSFVPGSVQQVYGQPVSLPQTPTSITPGSSYPPFQQQRPPSSHSTSTPTSGHAQTPTFLRDSPQQTHAQLRGSYGSAPNHPYSSQPGTPLGPPTLLGRQGSSLRRQSPGSYDHKRSNSGGSHGQPLQTPTSLLHNPSISSSTVYANQHTQSPPQQEISISQDRERSISVSPKTTLARQLVLSSVGAGLDISRSTHPLVAPAKRKIGDSRMDDFALQEQPKAKRSMSLGVGGMLNADNENENEPRIPNMRSHGQASNIPQMPPRGAVHCSNTQEDSSVTPGAASLPDAPSRGSVDSSNLSSPIRTAVAAEVTDRPLRAPSIPKATPATTSTSSIQPTPMEFGNDSMRDSDPVHNNTKAQIKDYQSSSTSAKPWKRFRDPRTPIPIYAQRYNRRGGPSNNGRRQATSKSPFAKKQNLPSSAIDSFSQQDTNGHVVPSMDAIQSAPDSIASFGPWERTITGVIPAEELTREIMDYIIQIIAPMKAIHGPILDMIEIEAKIGHIVDKDTDARIRLPGRTEVMIDHTNPSLRTTFRSSMTEVSYNVTHILARTDWRSPNISNSTSS